MSPRSWEKRAPRTHAESTAAKADLRRRILATVTRAGRDGITPTGLADDLATRATRSQVQAEAARMRLDGLLVHDNRGHGHRWFIAEDARAAAGCQP